MMAPDPTKITREEWDVHDWWVNLFCESGYERYQAESLIEAGVDWHKADELLQGGCPSMLAVKILV